MARSTTRGKVRSGPSPIQQLIIDFIDSRKPRLTRYRLARMCGWSGTKMYGKGSRLAKPVIHTAIEDMLTALGAEITIGRGSQRKRLRLAAVLNEAKRK